MGDEVPQVGHGVVDGESLDSGDASLSFEFVLEGCQIELVVLGVLQDDDVPGFSQLFEFQPDLHRRFLVLNEDVPRDALEHVLDGFGVLRQRRFNFAAKIPIAPLDLLQLVQNNVTLVVEYPFLDLVPQFPDDLVVLCQLRFVHFHPLWQLSILPQILLVLLLQMPQILLYLLQILFLLLYFLV